MNVQLLIAILVTVEASLSSSDQRLHRGAAVKVIAGGSSSAPIIRFSGDRRVTSR